MREVVIVRRDGVGTDLVDVNVPSLDQIGIPSVFPAGFRIEEEFLQDLFCVFGELSTWTADPDGQIGQLAETREHIHPRRTHLCTRESIPPLNRNSGGHPRMIPMTSSSRRSTSSILASKRAPVGRVRLSSLHFVSVRPMTG